MHALLSAAGRAFLRAFAGSLIAFSIIAAADWTKITTLHALALVGAAGLLGAIAAGIRSLQAFVPQLAFDHYLPAPWGSAVDSFARAFIATLVVLLPGALTAPDLSAGESLAVAAVVGAITAGLRALQGALTVGERPAPTSGVVAPPNP